MDTQKIKSHGAKIKIGLLSIYASMYHYYIDGIKIGSYDDKVWEKLVLTFFVDAEITRSIEDSQHISGLKNEMTLLKTFIMENFNNLTNLRRDESRAESEISHRPNDSDDSDGSVADAPPQPDDDQETESGSSSSDDEPRPADEDQENSRVARPNPSPFTDKRRIYRGDFSRSSSQFPSKGIDPEGGNIHRESNLLLQMVPYRPNVPGPISSDRLLPAEPGRDGSISSITKGPTESIRHLLDNWTVSGSAPISNILDEEVSKEKKEESSV